MLTSIWPTHYRLGRELCPFFLFSFQGLNLICLVTSVPALARGKLHLQHSTGGWLPNSARDCNQNKEALIQANQNLLCVFFLPCVREQISASLGCGTTQISTGQGMRCKGMGMQEHGFIICGFKLFSSNKEVQEHMSLAGIAF